MALTSPFPAAAVHVEAPRPHGACCVDGELEAAP
jgi:hypothetical protein